MLINVFVFVVSLLVLIYSSSFLIDSLIFLSEKHNIPNLFLGIFVIGFGSSLPEIFTSFSSVFAFKKNIAIGNVLGSNIANMLLVLGFAACITKLECKYEKFFKEYIVMLVVAAISIVVLRNGVVTFSSGWLLLLAFLASLFFLYKKSSLLSFAVEKKFTRDDYKQSYSLVFFIAILLLLIPISSYVMVLSGAKIAKLFGFSEFMIGATLVAFGTSLPELLSAYFAARKKDFLLILGNVIGSNIFNQTLVLSIVGLINSDFTDVYDSRIFVDACLVLLLSLSFILFTIKQKGFLVINKALGFLLLFVYFAYYVYNFF